MHASKGIKWDQQRSKSISTKLIQDIKNDGSKVFVVIDIDSTLVYTHERNQAILMDFCKLHRDQYPEECEQIRKVECLAGDYGYYSAFDRAQIQFPNPGSQEALKDFWRKNFFSNDYLQHDTPTPGARDFLLGLQEAQISFGYLTGRFKKTMWEGTKASFDNLGFPYQEELLTLKEDPNEKDELYKARAIAKFKELGHPIWLIDNEPMILHQMIKDHPDVKLIWFDLCHSGKKQPPPNIPHLKDFL